MWHKWVKQAGPQVLQAAPVCFAVMCVSMMAYLLAWVPGDVHEFSLEESEHVRTRKPDDLSEL